jgi:hypothetical protein
MESAILTGLGPKSFADNVDVPALVSSHDRVSSFTGANRRGHHHLRSQFEHRETACEADRRLVDEADLSIIKKGFTILMVVNP